MRTVWFVAGTAAGVYASVKARRVAESLTVDGLHDRLSGWFAGARVLGEELRSSAAQRETQLRARFDAVPHGRALESAPVAHGQPEPNEMSGNGRDD